MNMRMTIAQQFTHAQDLTAKCMTKLAIRDEKWWQSEIEYRQGTRCKLEGGGRTHVSNNNQTHANMKIRESEGERERCANCISRKHKTLSDKTRADDTRKENQTTIEHDEKKNPR